MTKFVDIAGAARVLAVASLVCSVAQAQTPQPPSFAKATDDGQWTMPAKDAASTRYSSLDEINGVRGVAPAEMAGISEQGRTRAACRAL